MGDISNKTLAGLVIIAIIISLVALFVVVGKFRIIKTGVATQTGGNVTVLVVTNIDVISPDNSIQFGNLETDRYNMSERIAGTDETLKMANDNITVRSLGTTPINIRYCANASMFLRANNTPPSNVNLRDNTNPPATNPCGASYSVGCADKGYRIRIMQTTGLDGTGCADNNYILSGYSSWVMVNDTPDPGTGPGLCLNPLIGNCLQYDNFTIGILVHAPLFEPEGSKGSRLDFIASQYTGGMT